MKTHKEQRLAERKAERQKGAEKAREVRNRLRTKKMRTSEKYLMAVVDEIGTDSVRDLVRVIMNKALEGDKDAWAWLGKFVLGNGKISLSELANPGILKRKG